MLGNIGDLFMKCMGQGTKSYLYHLLGIQITMYVIGLLCNVQAQGQVSFVKRHQRSPTGELIPLDSCVTFCEMFVVNGREF